MGDLRYPWEGCNNHVIFQYADTAEYDTEVNPEKVVYFLSRSDFKTVKEF